MIALPVIAFFIFVPPHHWSDSLAAPPLKCGLLTTSALSSAALFRLQPSCGEDFIRRQERMRHKVIGTVPLRIDNHFPGNARLASAYPSDA